jgi:hypothetical protein
MSHSTGTLTHYTSDMKGQVIQQITWQYISDNTFERKGNVLTMLSSNAIKNHQLYEVNPSTKLAQELTLLICIWEVLSLNLSQTPTIVTEVLHGFHQSLQTNTKRVP